MLPPPFTTDHVPPAGEAPARLNEILLLEQTVNDDLDTVTVGNGLTFTDEIAVLIQPLASSPVTVYVVLVLGETLMLAPV